MAQTNIAEDLQEQIVDELTIELSDDDAFNSDILEIKVRNAIREVKRKRNYPASYTTDMIEADLENYYDVIHELALYEYNKVGAEGQSLHSEDDVQRSWVSKDDLLKGVHAFVSAL